VAEIVLDKIGKRYANGFEAVKGLSLTIAEGELLVLVGPSGCGKTTALRMIAGLEDITDGDLYIDGKRMNDVLERDRDIAMVFQSYALYPHMTVAQNIAFSLRLGKRPKHEIRERVKETATLLGLENLLDRRPKQLSGGQRQRVAMGRAIIRQPRVFLMDEPLSNLDAQLRVQMRGEIEALQKRLGVTTVYVTHDQVEALTMGDRIAVMREGALQQIGGPTEVYDRPANLFVAGFIGSPSMNFLPARLEGDTIKLPFGDVPLPDRLRQRMEGGNGARDVIAGIRPEHFEDAQVAGEGHPGTRFRAKVAVVESMGAELYVYFDVESGPAVSDHLTELAKDAGMEDLPSHGDDEGTQVVARLDPASTAHAGAEVDLVLETEEIKLFDPSSGQSLTEPAPVAA